MTKMLQYMLSDVKIKAVVQIYSNIIKGEFLWTVVTELKLM